MILNSIEKVALEIKIMTIFGMEEINKSNGRCK
jgi:hypothetical protein